MSDIVNENQKRADFQNLLFELSESQEALDDAEKRSIFYNRLEGIYATKKGSVFRHFYSDILSVIEKVSDESEDGSLDVLAQNIIDLRKYYRSEVGIKAGLSDKLLKLEDHVNLEVARANAQRKIHWELKREKTSIETLQKNIEMANEELEKQRESISGAQKDYIAILSIFAAISLTAIGGLSFIGSILQGMKDVPFYRLVFVSILCGFVMFNVIMGLVYAISRVIDNPIGSECMRIKESCFAENGEKKCNECIPFVRIKGSMPYTYLINKVLIIMMVFFAACWFFDVNQCAEKIRGKIYDKQVVQPQIEEPQKELNP